MAAEQCVHTPAASDPAMPVAADALLVAIAKGRDRAAFATLFRGFAPRIKGFLIGRGVGPENADELVQEVMLSVWRRAEQFNPARGAARSWIFTIARNCLVDRVRATRRPEVELDDPALQDDFRTTEDQLLAHESHAALNSAIKGLPREQANVLMGAYYRGRTLGELANEQQIPLGTVKTRMRLALERLRGLLRPEVKST